jgi:N-methylhydantoinase B
MRLHPARLQVFKNRFASVAEEMGAALAHTAFSPNIKERRDLSCAVFDAKGEMVAQAAHIPVHLGSMPLSVKAAIEAVPLGDGDMAVLNDPYQGGTHLPDITLVAPVYAGSVRPVFYAANRAHHADVGGVASGSMPLSTSLFQEGLIIPPLKLVNRGETDPRLLRLILANVRTPAEREGDFAAQVMANLTGVKRLQEMIARHGLGGTVTYSRALLDHAEAVMRRTIAALPDGTYACEDFLDDDGAGARDVRIAVRIEIAGEKVRCDFTDSADQVRGCLNAVRAITLSAVLYVFRCLAESLGFADAPTNAGLLRPIRVTTRPGSILDARFPAAVAGGNVETSQRVVDVLLGALARAAPEIVPAASQGTMNNLAVGGIDPRTGEPFAYYETSGGGTGAWSGGDGESGVHSHMTNTLNTPIEALEYAYPLRVRRFGLRAGSGGAGCFRGGDGLVREIEFLAPGEATLLSERRVRGPWGLGGGGAGAPGRNTLVRKGKEKTMPGKFHAEVHAGDRLRIETPGGGGFGKG